MADRTVWLVLVYRVPTEPTRLRAAVWRRLKVARAVYLTNSVAALPASPAAERSLRKLRHEVSEMGGSALLLRAGGGRGARGDLGVQRGSDGEYADIIERCHDFLAKIASDSAAGRFTYAELEETGEELAKLTGSHEKVRAGDAFGASQAGSAASALAKCREALDGFTQYVDRAEGNVQRGD